MEFEKKLITLDGAQFSYIIAYPNSFSVPRLLSSNEKKARDYAHFLTANRYESRVVVAASNTLVKGYDIPNFMMYSLDKNIQFIGFRCMVAYWAQFYIDGKFGFAPIPKEANYAEIRDVFENWQSQGVVNFGFPGDFATLACPKAITVGDAGYLSEVCSGRDNLISSSGHSAIIFEECTLPFQSLRDPIGFRADNGVVTSLPMYNRPCILETSSGFQMRYLSGQDFEISACNNQIVAFRGLGRDQDKFRVTFPNGQCQRTAANPDAVELVIVEQRVVAVCFGGNIPIPTAGVVITSTSKYITSQIIAELLEDNTVRFQPKTIEGLRTGIQCGPTLVEKGKKCSIESMLQQQAFLSSTTFGRVVPISLQTSAGSTKAARSMLGLTKNGKLILVIMEGTATSVAHSNDGARRNQASGASFDELAEIAIRENMHEAMALDNGGSVGLLQNGKKLIESGDFRKTSNTRFERPLANAIIYY